MSEMSFPRSVELLNKAVDAEIASSLQYMYFHAHLSDSGYRELSKYFKMIAVREMIHVEMFTDRILYLEGDVDMNTSYKTRQITDVDEMLKFAMKLEASTIKNYNEWAKECGAENDATTKRIFERVLEEEEDHFDSFRTEDDNLQQFGTGYLMLESHSNMMHKIMPKDK